MSKETALSKWTEEIDLLPFHGEQSRMIEDLLVRLKSGPPDVEDVWNLMDEVWDEIGIDNRDPDPAMLDEFYDHPVWLLNGLFVESDELSMNHRRAIRDWISSKKTEIATVVDFGGGLGTMGRLIAEIGEGISVDIFEPYASKVAKKKADCLENLHFVEEPGGSYDCLVSLDVLEHVTEPVKILGKMIENVRLGGYLIIANNFHPVIKCHLPGTFHLRFTFRLFAWLMGLSRLGPCKGSHAAVYRKVRGPVRHTLIRVVEKISTMLYVPMHVPYFIYQLFRTV